MVTSQLSQQLSHNLAWGSQGTVTGAIKN